MCLFVFFVTSWWILPSSTPGQCFVNTKESSDGLESRGSLREPNGLIAERSETLDRTHLRQPTEGTIRVSFDDKWNLRGSSLGFDEDLCNHFLILPT